MKKTLKLHNIIMVGKNFLFLNKLQVVMNHSALNEINSKIFFHELNYKF